MVSPLEEGQNERQVYVGGGIEQEASPLEEGMKSAASHWRRG